MSQSMKTFVQELSTNSPAPGGGSVAALAGSLAGGLASMVAALTHEKKGFEMSKDEMESIGTEAQNLKDRLVKLVDEDTEAFNQMMEAGRMPGKSDEEKKAKADAVEAAAKNGVAVPLETADAAMNILKMASVLVEKGNPNSVSDAGVAGEMAFGAVRGGVMNAMINLPGIEDKAFAEATRTKCTDLLHNAESLHSEVFSKTMETIQAG